MPTRLTVDRIEEGFAICEDEHKHMHEIPLDLLPGGVKEGDCLLRQEDEDRYIPDPHETQRRREANIALLRRLMRPAGEEDAE